MGPAFPGPPALRTQSSLMSRQGRCTEGASFCCDLGGDVSIRAKQPAREPSCGATSSWRPEPRGRDRELASSGVQKPPPACRGVAMGLYLGAAGPWQPREGHALLVWGNAVISRRLGERGQLLSTGKLMDAGMWAWREVCYPSSSKRCGPLPLTASQEVTGPGSP